MEIDSDEFQAEDDMYCIFSYNRTTQEWKDKVLENVKMNEAARIKSDNIKTTFEYLLTIDELWEFPLQYRPGIEGRGYHLFCRMYINEWREMTLEKAASHFEGFARWDDLSDSEHSVRVMVYLL